MRLLGPLTLLALLLLTALTVLTSVAAGAGAEPVGVWPLLPRPPVVRGFDPPDSPWGSGHRGVDLRGRVGQVVRSALPGRVAWAGLLAGRGVVVVDHGATRTTYEPVAAAARVGEQVEAGEAIGTLELAGSHCLPGACLHWGWLRGSMYLDPLRLVGAGPVRLLPLWRAQSVAAVSASALPYVGAMRLLPRPVPISSVARVAACPGPRPMGPVGQARGCACW